MTLEESAKLVYMAASVFPTKQDTDLKLTAKAWMMILSDIPYKLAEAALIKVLSTAKFFPVPADIREAAISFIPGPPTAEEAWKEVRKYVSSGSNSIRYQYNGERPEWSHKIIKITSDQIGVWEMFNCENMNVLMGQFIKMYNKNLDIHKDKIETERVLKLTGGQALLENKEA